MSREPGTAFEIDYPQLRREIHLAIRGRLSQARLNQKLGYKSNRVHRWESGAAAFLWSHFREVCLRSGRPFETALREQLQFSGPLRSTGMLVAHLLGDERQSVSAQRLGVSRSMISRWRSGQVDPTLEQMLKIIHLGFYSMTQFLDRLIGVNKLHSIADILTRERRERELHFKFPWIGALVLCLRTVEYEALGGHREGYLASKLGISLESERRVVRELLELGVLEYDHKLLCPSRRSLNTGNDLEGGRRIREYWTEKFLAFIQRKTVQQPGQKWNYMVLNLNSETSALIRDRYDAFIQDVHSIIHSSRAPSEQVAVMNFQMLPLQDLTS